MLSVYIVYRMHKVERRMVKTIVFLEMCLRVFSVARYLLYVTELQSA